MFLKRAGFACVVLTLGLSTARAQTVHLGEDKLQDQCFRVQIQMNLQGTMKFQQAGKEVTLPEKAQAHHEYLERILVARDPIAEQSARLYQKAQANIQVGNDRFERTIRPDRLSAVALRWHDRPLVYSRKGALTREEIEATEHFDSLALPGLLPNQNVQVGSTWKIPHNVIQSLALLEGLTGHTIVGKLDEVRENVAHFSLSGELNGIDLGATVNAKVTAKGQFHLTAKRLTALTWNAQETRSQGPVNPGFQLEMQVSLQREAIAEPKDLDKVSTISIDFPKTDKDFPTQETQVSFTHAGKRFTLLHGREWIFVNQTDKHVVLRLMEQGDFVAQGTLAPWTKTTPGQILAFDQFQKLMMETPGWEPESIISRDAKLDGLPKGYLGSRLAVAGKLQGSDVVQYFYLVAGPDGEQLVVTFTMTPNQVQKLASRDFLLVQGLRLLGR